jgi:hypothetical protein
MTTIEKLAKVVLFKIHLEHLVQIQAAKMDTDRLAKLVKETAQSKFKKNKKLMKDDSEDTTDSDVSTKPNEIVFNPTLTSSIQSR